MGDDSRTRFPKCTIFIVFTEFGESFCYSGIRSVSVLYASQELDYTDEYTRQIFYLFVCMTYLSPLIGGMIADSCLGKFWTIILMGVLYLIGIFVLMSGTIPAMNALGQPLITYIGLVIIAIAAGGYKPCSSSFGGDHFVIPAQRISLSRFFSAFYFALSLGSVLSIVLTPELPRRIECFKQDTCYPLGLGVPGLSLLVALIIFLGGFTFYNRARPEINIFIKFYGCIIRALFMRIKNIGVKKDHWLDFASDSYDQAFISDMKIFFSALTMLAPLPIFWCLYEQQYLGWYEQARAMDGKLGETGYTILPFQMQMTRSAAVLIFILLFEIILYPLLRMCHIGHRLQRMCFGGILAGIAFIAAGVVSMKIEAMSPVPVPGGGYGQVRIYNNLFCNIQTSFTAIGANDTVLIKKFDFWLLEKVRICGAHKKTLHVKQLCYNLQAKSVDVWLYENKANAIYFYDREFANTTYDFIKPSEKGMARVRFLAEHRWLWQTQRLTFTGVYHKQKISILVKNPAVFEVLPDTYNLAVGKHKNTIELTGGSVFAVLLATDPNNNWASKLVTVASRKRINIIYQLPQNFLLAAGEVMLVITALEFAYTQAPKSMKAVLVAHFWGTYALGTLIVILINSLQINAKLSSQFFFYSLVMLLDMLVMACMSMRYQYSDL